MISRIIFFLVFSVPVSSHTLDFQDLYQTHSEKLSFFKSLQMRNLLQSSDSPVLNLIDSQYLVSLSIGSPAQTFRMIPDLVNTQSWVPASACWSLACFLHARFKGSQSSTYTAEATRFSQAYGSGKVSGSVSQDIFRVQNFTYKARFGEALSFEGPSWLAARFDGVLSLRSLLEEDSQQIELQSRNNKVSSLFAGCSEGFSFVEADKEKSYSMVGTGMWIGHNRVLKEFSVIFDLQTPLILLDRTIYAAFPDKIKVDAKCRNIQELPNIMIQVQGVSIVLSPEDYVFRSGNECILRIVSWEFPEKWGNTIVLGSVLLSKYDVCFDVGGTVGFRKLLFK